MTEAVRSVTTKVTAQSEAKPVVKVESAASIKAAAKVTAPARAKVANTDAKKAATPAPRKSVVSTKSSQDSKPAKAANKISSTGKDSASNAKSVSKPTVKAVKTEKLEKLKKPKMVRDSFSMPKNEYVALDALKARATQLKLSVKKTELIRAGIKALTAMNDAAFKAAVVSVPNLKTGRPTKS